MESPLDSNFADNEKNLKTMIRHTSHWIKTLFYVKEEIQFLNGYIKAAVFKKSIPNMFEKLSSFTNIMNEFDKGRLDLEIAVKKHQKIIEGIRECEDINCDLFYQETHQELSIQVEFYIDNFNSAKLDLYNYTTALL